MQHRRARSGLSIAPPADRQALASLPLLRPVTKPVSFCRFHAAAGKTSGSEAPTRRQHLYLAAASLREPPLLRRPTPVSEGHSLFDLSFFNLPSTQPRSFTSDPLSTTSPPPRPILRPRRRAAPTSSPPLQPSQGVRSTPRRLRALRALRRLGLTQLFPHAPSYSFNAASHAGACPASLGCRTPLASRHAKKASRAAQHFWRCSRDGALPGSDEGEEEPRPNICWRKDEAKGGKIGRKGLDRGKPSVAKLQ